MSDAGKEPTQPEATWPAYDRRRGPRRTHAEGSPAGERRENDRRKNTPGLQALLRAIMGRGGDSSGG